MLQVASIDGFIPSVVICQVYLLVVIAVVLLHDK